MFNFDINAGRELLHLSNRCYLCLSYIVLLCQPAVG